MRIIIFLISFIVILNLSATIINIPADYPTIQAGIDASTNLDTVLVQPGTYIENINFIGKSITVASLYITTQDSSYIEQTIIDGNQIDTVVKFVNEEDSLTVLSGFTITNGNAGNTIYCDGGGINCQWEASPTLKNLIIINNYAGNGGGVYVDSYSPAQFTDSKIFNNTSFFRGGGIYIGSSSLISNVIVSNNTSDGIGGGMYISSSPDLMLENVSIINNTAQLGGGIYSRTYGLSFSSENRCNIYQNTISDSRGFGADIYFQQSSYSAPVYFDVIVDTFTVFNPTGYYASPIQYITFDIIHSQLDSLINADVYVSPDGNDTNSGLTSEEPFKTIKYALSRIYSDSLNSNSINLLPGEYSTSSNGEQFPLYWSDYVKLRGSLEEESIIDGENQTVIMKISHASNVIIEDLTIINGSNDYNTGSIDIFRSNVVLSNLTIGNCEQLGSGYAAVKCEKSNLVVFGSTFMNNTFSYGGGLFIYDESTFDIINSEFIDNYASHGGGLRILESSGSISNCSFIGNESYYHGGGIEIISSNVDITNCIISNNVVTSNFPGYDNNGGGINCIEESFVTAYNVLINDNYADFGGGIYCDDSTLELINITMTNNTGNQFAGLNSQFSDVTIINSIIWGNNVQDILVFLSDSNINYSDIGEGEYLPGIGNINTDPLFSSLGLHQYSLSDLSPCINVGIQDTTGLYIPEFDLAGNNRVYGNRIDMGAYENQNVIVGTNENLVSKVTKLNQNHPNPFNPTTTISFSISNDSDVDISIYNIKGQKINNLTHNEFSKGSHSIVWNGDDESGEPVSSGVYLYKLKVNGKMEAVRKCILLK